MRHSTLISSLFALCACGGPNEETLIDELRVVAVVAEPAEVGPGETMGLSTLTHIPANSATERMTWTCIYQGDGCAEAASGQFEGWVHIDASSEDEWVTHTLEIPESLGAFLNAEVETLLIPTWTLACEPGLCPLFEQIKNNPTSVSSAWEGIAAQLSNPFEWLAELPKEGVSLATRSVVISSRPEASRNQNPVVVRSNQEDITVAIEGSTKLSFEVNDDDPLITVWGYTSRGGFESTQEEFPIGTFEQTLFAPIDPEMTGPGTLYIVAEDGKGGTGVWSGPFIILPGESE
jgi:hypothetical protein